MTAWHLHPLMLGVVLAAAAGYLVGVVRLRRTGTGSAATSARGWRGAVKRPEPLGKWPAGRTLAFLGLGMTSLVLTTLAWPAVYAPVLFWVYALQVTMLLLVVPFLAALGRPIQLAQTSLGPRGRARLEAVLHSRAARVFTVPVVSPLLLAVVPFVLYFTPLYRMTLEHPVLLPLVHLVLLLVGLAVLVPLWEAEALAARVPYALALLFAFIELLLDAVPGIVIRLQTHVIAAGYFTALARPWGPTPLHDQQLGGDLLWCVGEAVDVPFLLLLIMQWLRSDAREAARIDRALDLAAQTGHGPSAGGAAEPFDRPWWEKDASVFGDRATEFHRRPDA